MQFDSVIKNMIPYSIRFSFCIMHAIFNFIYKSVMVIIEIIKIVFFFEYIQRRQSIIYATELIICKHYIKNHLGRLRKGNILGFISNFEAIVLIEDPVEGY